MYTYKMSENIIIPIMSENSFLMITLLTVKKRKIPSAKMVIYLENELIPCIVGG